ncbi:hypothetical protein IAQ61_012012 [Plenodomus lingam]|uniref:uncharacterized protein n=1 Tax=Leptosphaeria maculans TaxID=5022 RepID=UPI0033170902|nr:hypothetical protein IAQ61_012012 [Plenodomus lingam]
MPSATPLITATTLLAAPAHDKAMLQDIHDLLNKLFIRNRNQHRRSHWWKSLHAFRKQIGLLLADLDGKKSERTEKLEERLRYWDNKCIHMWYYRFSQLVAVGPFAMLGLVMMASVARVCRICGITAVYEEIASRDVQGVLTANDELALAEEFGGVLDGEDEWDEGVVVARKEEEEEEEEEEEVEA